MNDFEAAGSTPGSSTPRACVRERHHASRRTLLFYLGTCLIGTLVAAYAWRNTSLPASHAAAGAKPAAVAPRLASAAHTSPAAPGALTSIPSSAASAEALPVARSAVDFKLASLSSDYQRLLQRASDAEQRIEQLESSQADMQHRLEQGRAVVAPGSASVPKRSPVARPTRIAATVPSIETQSTETLLPPQVLAVDTWAGQPSVSIIVGTQIRFLVEGDSVSGLLVKKADPVSQRVDFATRTGAIVSTTAPAVGDAK